MQAKKLNNCLGQTIEGPLLITPKVLEDERGWFFESWNQQRFDNLLGETVNFSQDNHSRSVRGVLRGLHYQKTPKAQAKLIRASLGEIFDVAVDIRSSSPTFGHWVSATLSAKNKAQLWVPEGFAHGFLTMSDTAEVQYKTRGLWNGNYEKVIQWNDKDIGIKWPLKFLKENNVILSKKDEEASGLASMKIKGELFE